MKTTTSQSYDVHVPALRLVDEPGVRYGIAHAGLVAAALVAGGTHLPDPATFLVLGLTALAGGRVLSLGWRVGIAVSAWAIWTGFFENAQGVLTFTGPDALRLAALLALATWVRL